MAPIEQNYLKLKKIEKGNPSPAFSLQNKEGVNITLDELKGQLIYIDVWATWCKPCMAEMPYLKTLEKHFEKEEITFVSICINDQKKNWLSVITEKEGIQLFASDPNDPFIDSYAITGIPRFILLDREGVIIDAYAKRPSDKNLIPEIESFL